MTGEKLEELMKKDVLKAIEDWDARARLMKIDHLCNYYKRIGLPESIINKVIDELKEGGLL